MARLKLGDQRTISKMYWWPTKLNGKWYIGRHTVVQRVVTPYTGAHFLEFILFDVGKWTDQEMKTYEIRPLFEYAPR